MTYSERVIASRQIKAFNSRLDSRSDSILLFFKFGKCRKIFNYESVWKAIKVVVIFMLTKANDFIAS